MSLESIIGIVMMCMTFVIVILFGIIMCHMLNIQQNVYEDEDIGEDIDDIYIEV